MKLPHPPFSILRRGHPTLNFTSDSPSVAPPPPVSMRAPVISLSAHLLLIKPTKGSLIWIGSTAEVILLTSNCPGQLGTILPAYSWYSGKMKWIFFADNSPLLIMMPSLRRGDREESPGLTLNPQRFSVSSGLLERDPSGGAAEGSCWEGHLEGPD